MPQQTHALVMTLFGTLCQVLHTHAAVRGDVTDLEGLIRQEVAENTAK